MKSEVYNQSLCLVLKAASMYYLEKHSQKDIAESLNISVPTVSRLLKRAKEEGIISFVMPAPYCQCLELEKELRLRYGLKEVIVVPPSDEERSPLEVKKAVALEGARYVQRMIKPDDILGIAWGGTMYELIQYLNPCQKTAATFVTLHGSITSCNSKFDVNTLVRRIAMAFGGKQYAISTPGLLSSAQEAEKMRQRKDIAYVFSLFEKISFSVSGIGSFYPEPTSPLSQLSYLSEQEYQTLSAYSPYGDLILRFIDENGSECPGDLARRTLAIGLETYRKIPRKLIAASGTHKAHTLKAALKGGLADVLIIDYALAKKLSLI